MKLAVRDLDDAVTEGILDVETRGRLGNWLETRQSKSSLGFQVLAYLGALVVISSLTWFATRAFSEANPVILLATGLSYFVGFTAVGMVLQRRLTSPVPSMLLLTVAVFMVPLTVYSIQRLLGLVTLEDLGNYHDFFVWINRGWFFMELGTLVVASVYLVAFKHTFLTFPLAFVLWFLSMDIAPLLVGPDVNWEVRRQVSIAFGVAMLFLGYGLDLGKKDRDYAFCLYLFGLLAFWCAISASSTDQLLLKFLYCGLNLVLIGVAVLLTRPVFLVFGSLGVFLFLWDITTSVFRDSLLFPIYLSLVGIGILFGAILLMKNQRKIEALITSWVPEKVRAFIPRRRT